MFIHWASWVGSYFRAYGAWYGWMSMTDSGKLQFNQSGLQLYRDGIYYTYLVSRGAIDGWSLVREGSSRGRGAEFSGFIVKGESFNAPEIVTNTGGRTLKLAPQKGWTLFIPHWFLALIFCGNTATV